MAKQQPQAPQQIHPAAAAAEFMQRAELKGNEVEVFAQTFNWLQQILKGEILPIDREMHAAQVERLAALEAFMEENELQLPEQEEGEGEEKPGPENNHGLPEGASFIPGAAKAEAVKPA